jgi:hypothetical protein
MKRVLQPYKYKKLVSIVLTSFLLGFVFLNILEKQNTPIDEEIVQEVEGSVRNLTQDDLSLLYSFKPDKRTKDTIDITQSEAMMAMKIARAEGGDSLDGQLWVLRVIINRMLSNDSDFKTVNTIGEVAYQKGQFDVVKTGKFESAQLNENSHLALAMVEGGWDDTDGALWFEADSGESTWHSRNLTLVAIVEGQRYYK